MRISKLLFGWAALAALASPSSSQANADANTEVKLGILGSLKYHGRTGPAYPDGVAGISMSTTVCNLGSTEVPWLAPMNADHPTISFILARESDGRLLQISDRSFLKHGFFALTSSQCTPCTPPGQGAPGQYLGQGCSDTYNTTNNGDNYWLGPADEIDPWLGTWDPVCSHFDRGEPDVGSPNNCNGLRSLTSNQASALGPVGHRINVDDADLDVPGASYYYQAQYNIAREPEGTREDNLGFRSFAPSWSGSVWVVPDSGTLQHGSVLQAWSGASMTSATGPDNGRVYTAQKVGGPVNGLYRYELAFHNRDNSDGISELRLPVCDGARILNVGFHDLDDDAGNDWQLSLAGGQAVFTDVSGTNPLRWNTIYNVWFESDAAPGTVDLTLMETDSDAIVFAGAQAPQVLYNAYTGPGCSFGTTPTLFATGAPARATLGNASFGVQANHFAPGALNFLAASNSLSGGSLPLSGCVMHLGGTLGIEIYGLASVTVNGSGEAIYSLPVPNNGALEGIDFRIQALGLNPGGGPAFGFWEFSDGLNIRMGDNTSSCP